MWMDEQRSMYEWISVKIYALIRWMPHLRAIYNIAMWHEDRNDDCIEHDAEKHRKNAWLQSAVHTAILNQLSSRRYASKYKGDSFFIT